MTDNSVILEGKNLAKLISEAEVHFNTNKNSINIEMLEEKKSLFGSYYKIKATYEYNVESTNIERIINSIEDVLTLSDANIDSIEENAADNELDQSEEGTDCKYEVTTSTDAMEAYIIVYPPVRGKEIQKEDIYDALKEKNIRSGILHDAVDKLAELKQYNNSVLIAKGRPPVNGIDASIKYHFDVSKDNKVFIEDDGKIDYKELSLISNVSEGDILVTMTPASTGTNGENVFGEEIQAKDGKKVNMPKGKNVTLSEDEMQLISMIKGEAKVVDGKVSVFPIFTVDGNVDNSTGNIRFVGKVVVKGNVITGFSIEAEEDVEVYGFVEGAKIHSKGSIVLHRGIQGMNKGELVCDGDLIAKFIENSKVYAKGNIKTDAIMHSIIFCGKKLEVKGKKGLLVGGEIKVSEEIIAKTVGSPMATATEIEVGINPDVRKKYDDFKVEYDICSDNLIKLSQVVDLLTKLSKKAELADDKRALLNKSIILKLQTQSKLEGLKKEIQELETYIEDISKGKVKVESIVYPGTKITIGSSSIFIRDQIQFVTFYRAFGEVKIGSFES